MLFNSPLFVFAFLPIVLAIYFALNHRRLTQAGKAWLVSASLVYYGYWDPRYLLLILLSITFNYIIGTALARSFAAPSAQDHHPLPSRKVLLLLGVTANLAVLGYYKYANFFLDNIREVLGTQVPVLQIVLPLGISFITFQKIAYLVDSYRGETREYDFLNFSLFVVFFPQLIAGPIVHHAEVMPQFSRIRNTLINWRNVALGLVIFCVGLIKKVMVADLFAEWASRGFDGNAELSALDAWSASLCYTMQLYFDFSGYTDMAIGAALMFNIRLPLNFNSPYKAADLQEFWRRWHMTLSRWLRDYLYIPLGGNRNGEPRTYFNLFVTFLLGGFWHGAGWTFVLWGALHGGGLVIHRLWHRAGLRLPTLAGWAVTFLFVNVAWVFFRATDVAGAGRILRGMAGMNGLGDFAHAQVSSPVVLAYLAFFSLVVLLARNTQQQTSELRRFGWQHVVIVAVGGLIAVLSGVKSANSPFLYFNF